MDLLTTSVRVVVSLGIVFALIWFISRRLLHRNGTRTRRTSEVQVLGKAGVAAKASVVVVETEGKRLVLGVTEHGVSVLHEADAPEPTPAEIAAAEAAAARRAPARDDLAAALTNPKSAAAFGQAMLQQLRQQVKGLSGK